MSKGFIYIVGLGPGSETGITKEADEAIRSSDVIVGYQTYIDLVKERYPGKELFPNGMKMEIDRCKKCVAFAKEGKKVALICSGDAGVYGMASPMLEVALSEGFTDVKVIPGVSAAMSGAAIVGAPVGHDFCVISLSDLLTPWDVIEKRLSAAADGDFCIVLYNPSSHKRKDYLMKACEILLKSKSESTVCAIARNIGREGESAEVLTLRELKSTQTDMFTTVFIGNSKSRKIGSYMVTPRGYLNE
ncbi:MAG: precorrin-3B C(17)-methyltransferase [Lachnospiraceae bacterium]|nr:precorrin-3B C(17)-methyltransferase [Lachnospiraceae bacterium]